MLSRAGDWTSHRPGDWSIALRRHCAAFILVCVAVGLSGCGDRGETITLRVAHTNSVGHPVHEALLHFAAVVSERSGGSMRAVVYPAGQLGSERQLIELTQIGSIDIVKTSAATMEAFAPEYAVFGVPFLFRDEAHELAVLDGPIGSDILAGGEAFRLRGLCFFDAGARSFYLKGGPAEGPDDLAGLKIRTQSSPSAIRMVEAMGATPTPIAFSELYSALAAGVVDGAENNPPSYHLTRHYEVAPFYSLSEHTAVPDVVAIAWRTWDRLSDSQRRTLRGAAAEATALQRELWGEAEREAFDAVRAGGATILRPDRAVFAERVAGLKERAKRGPLGPLLERVDAAGG